jgi:hypothetical protein
MLGHAWRYAPANKGHDTRGSWISGARFSRTANKTEHCCIQQENNHVWCVPEKMFFKFF